MLLQAPWIRIRQLSNQKLFYKGDTPLFLGKHSVNLSADEFWKCIYKAVFWRLLDENG